MSNSPEYVNETQAASTQSTSNPRRKTSWIWKHFHESPETPERVICNYCNKEYVHKKGSGLGSLERHYKHTHNKETTTTDLKQSKLKIGTSGNVVNWNYNLQSCREGLVKFIIHDEQPFNFSENPRFIDFQINHVNPEFQGCSRNTTKRHAVKMFNNEKEQLIESLYSLTSKICLTSDVWTGPNEWPYICIIAHWIDI